MRMWDSRPDGYDLSIYVKAYRVAEGNVGILQMLPPELLGCIEIVAKKEAIALSTLRGGDENDGKKKKKKKKAPPAFHTGRTGRALQDQGNYGSYPDASYSYSSSFSSAPTMAPTAATTGETTQAMTEAGSIAPCIPCNPNCPYCRCPAW